MYSDFVNNIAAFLVGRLPGRATGVEGDLWSTILRYTPPEPRLTPLVEGLPALECLEGHAACSPEGKLRPDHVVQALGVQGTKEALRRAYDLLTGCPPAHRNVVFFNSCNALGKSETPALLALNVDRSLIAVWSDVRSSKGYLASYDAQGAHVGSWRCQFRRGKVEPEDLPRKIARKMPSGDRVLSAFLQSLVERHDRLVETQRASSYPSSTHVRLEGGDGSLLVLNRKSMRIDNPCGPALLTSSGRAVYFIQGKEVTQSLWNQARRRNPLSRSSDLKSLSVQAHT